VGNNRDRGKMTFVFGYELALQLELGSSARRKPSAFRNC
jgi:hypothetical protein